MNEYNDTETINAGSGEEYSIFDLAHLVAYIVEYEGEIVWDKTKPNGTPRKRLDLTKLNKLGWRPQYSLEEGLKITYEHFQKENNI